MVIKKKKARWVSMILSVMMVFAFMPFLGTQEAYAVPMKDEGVVHVDLTESAQTYEGAEAAAIYAIIDEAINSEMINARVIAGTGDLYELYLDVNRDTTDDMGLVVEKSGDKVLSLELRVIDGCSQSGEIGFGIQDTSFYRNLSEWNDYGLQYFYDTIIIQFPEIQYVDTVGYNTKWIHLYGSQLERTYSGAEAAAMYTLLMDPKARLNGNGRAIRHDMVDSNEAYTAYNFCLDEDDDPDVYAVFYIDDTGGCNNAYFEIFPEYEDYDTILVNLPTDRLNYYGTLTVPNEYGLEFMYMNLMFDARKPIDGAEVELSATTFTYNGKIQHPEVVKVGGMELIHITDYSIDWGDENSTEPGTYTMKVYGEGHYRGTAYATYKIDKLVQTVTLAKTAYTKTFGNAAFNLGTKTNGDGTLKYSSSNTKVATVSSAGKVSIKGAGVAKITVYAAEGKHYKKSNSKTVTVTINKAKNPLAVTGKTATVTYSKVKNAAQKLALYKVIKTSKKGKGTVTYTKKTGNGKITIAKKTGKVTVKKGINKGIYTVKVNVRAAGTKNYKALTKTVTFKIKVK